MTKRKPRLIVKATPFSPTVDTSYVSRYGGQVPKTAAQRSYDHRYGDGVNHGTNQPIWSSDVRQGQRVKDDPFKMPPKGGSQTMNDRPRTSPDQVISGLGLSKGQESQWRSFLDKALTQNEVAFRASVMSKSRELPNDVRRIVNERALSLYRTRQFLKAAPSTVTIDALHKGLLGGKYYRRTPDGKGGHKYHYDADKYANSPDAHLSGADVAARRLSTKWAAAGQVSSDDVKNAIIRYGVHPIDMALVSIGFKLKGKMWVAVADRQGVARVKEGGDAIAGTVSKAETGEGSRGGVITGHTSTGHPIYGERQGGQAKYDDTIAAGKAEADHQTRAAYRTMKTSQGDATAIARAHETAASANKRAGEASQDEMYTQRAKDHADTASNQRLDHAESLMKQHATAPGGVPKDVHATIQSHLDNAKMNASEFGLNHIHGRVNAMQHKLGAHPIAKALVTEDEARGRAQREIDLKRWLKQMGERRSPLRKGGEGSRGGHVTGHTSTGKPIYATGGSAGGTMSVAPAPQPQGSLQERAAKHNVPLERLQHTNPNIRASAHRTLEAKERVAAASAQKPTQTGDSARAVGRANVANVQRHGRETHRILQHAGLVKGDPMDGPISDGNPEGQDIYASVINQRDGSAEQPKSTKKPIDHASEKLDTVQVLDTDGSDGVSMVIYDPQSLVLTTEINAWLDANDPKLAKANKPKENPVQGEDLETWLSKADGAGALVEGQPELDEGEPGSQGIEANGGPLAGKGKPAGDPPPDSGGKGMPKDVPSPAKDSKGMAKDQTEATSQTLSKADDDTIVRHAPGATLIKGGYPNARDEDHARKLHAQAVRAKQAQLAKADMEADAGDDGDDGDGTVEKACGDCGKSGDLCKCMEKAQTPIRAGRGGGWIVDQSSDAAIAKSLEQNGEVSRSPYGMRTGIPLFQPAKDDVVHHGRAQAIRRTK